MGFCTPSQRREHFTKLNENLLKGSEDTEKFRVSCGQMDGRIDRRRALLIPFRCTVSKSYGTLSDRIPTGTGRRIDVAPISIWRHFVASMSMPCHNDVMCQLG